MSAAGDRPPRTPGERARALQRVWTIAFSCVFIVIGFVMIGITVARGGGIGYVIGPLFTALGAGRLRLALRRPGDGPGTGTGAGRDKR